MQDIAEWTLRQPVDGGGPGDETESAVPREVGPEEPGELARMLEGSELTPDWVDGFLAAVVVAPKMVRPGDWIEELVGEVPTFRARGRLQRFLDIVMPRYMARWSTWMTQSA
jgi:hypothetical protein